MKHLKIIKCNDPLMWYAGLVGQHVPYLGEWRGEGHKSREPAGFLNIVKFGAAARTSAERSSRCGSWTCTTGTWATVRLPS